MRIARTLVNHYKVKPDKLVILTQYQLQRKKIELSLKSHQREQASKIDVRTVIKSQGKYGYCVEEGVWRGGGENVCVCHVLC